MNVYEFAMKMELDGKAFYEKLKAGTSVVGLKKIFSMLADDEQKHYDTILDYKEKAGKAQMEESKALENARNIFAEIIEEKKKIDIMKEDLDGYRLAMKIESDSVQFYEDAAKRERREPVRNMLLKLAEEEKKHYNIVENIYDFVLRPDYFLEWREFSNLKQL